MAWFVLASRRIDSTAEAGVPYFLGVGEFQPPFAVTYTPIVQTPPDWTVAAYARLYQGFEGYAVAQEDIPVVISSPGMSLLIPRLIISNAIGQVAPWGVQFWTVQVVPAGDLEVWTNDAWTLTGYP